MCPVPAIRVTPVTPALAAAVDALQVTPGQAAHVGDTAFNLRLALDDPRCDAMAIVLDDAASGDTLIREQVIGFYRLDHAPTIISRTPISATTIGLRAFMIDRRWQGRGLGVRALAACCADLRQRHPTRRLLALNVDCSNVAAIRTYRMAGFVDTGELYRGGRAGPQRLMLRRL